MSERGQMRYGWPLSCSSYPGWICLLPCPTEKKWVGRIPPLFIYLKRSISCFLLSVENGCILGSASPGGGCEAAAPLSIEHPGSSASCCSLLHFPCAGCSRAVAVFVCMAGRRHAARTVPPSRTVTSFVVFA